MLASTFIYFSKNAATYNLPPCAPVFTTLSYLANMTISIIIPVYNESGNIARTVAYLRQHGGRDVVEICVVDGGSTDDTVQQATEAGATVLLSPEKGRAAQMNFGAQLCRGDVLYFVHADSLPPPNFVRQIAQAIQQGWMLGNFRYRFDSDSRMLRFNAWFTRFSWMFCQGGDKTLFVVRSFFESLGGYDPYYVIMEEYDFFRRARKAGQRWVVMPDECVVSARKYGQRSWLKVQVANLVVFNLWSMRLASPAALDKIYKRLLK